MFHKEIKLLIYLRDISKLLNNVSIYKKSYMIYGKVYFIRMRE